MPLHAAGLAPPIVVDSLTGVALDGFDPVSYFTDGQPSLGKPDYEYDWRGVPWYFASGANRDVFIRSPEIYAPQFGGHSTTALTQGYLSDGNPQIYIVAAKRLYLFYSIDNRDAFTAAPIPVIAEARSAWQKLSGIDAAMVAPDTPQPPAVASTAAPTP
ncbi:MAG: YHS domain-containing (seleno)protein [Devosia sp.]